jgi:hypothetical protein
LVDGDAEITRSSPFISASEGIARNVAVDLAR